MNDQHPTKGDQTRLLVPMNIEAMVIGARQPGTQWVDRVPMFQGIYYNLFLGQQLETEACSSTVPDLYDEPGVYLHWALPDGLTHGITGDNGSEPDFPLIPNRWLIVRYWDRNQNGSQPDLDFKAWIMESDTITDDDNALVWPILTKQNPDPANESDYYVRVGKRFELASWPGETECPGVDITAIGYGDTAFAAYYPACRGILGFHDKDLDGIPDDISLNYLIAGWYSKSANDPLARGLTKKTVACLAELLNERKWTYPGFSEDLDLVNEAEVLADRYEEARQMLARLQNGPADLDPGQLTAEHRQAIRDDVQKGIVGLKNEIKKLKDRHQSLLSQIEALQGNLPGQILCHGILAGLRWRGQNHLYDSGVPRDEPFSVAVGNTAVEALSALFARKLNPELVRLLEVFQYDLLADLEKPGGPSNVDHKIHERAFKQLTQGIYWELIQENQVPAAGSADGVNGFVARPDQTPPIPGEIRLLLESLNRRQVEINRLKRERSSLKSELYATWYKQVLNHGGDAARDGLLVQRRSDLEQQIDALNGRIAQLADAGEERARGPEWRQLQEELAGFCPDWQVQKLDEPRFWRSNDPVVLLAGRQFQRSPRHGEDGRYRSDGVLQCRLSGQEITGFKITIPNAKIEAVEFGPRDLDLWCPSFFKSLQPGIPIEVADLFRESLLLTLDSKGTHAIAAAAYDKNEPGLAARYPQQVEELAALSGKFFRQVWEEARNPDAGDISLRFEDHQTVLELIGSFPSPVVLNNWQKNPWLPLFLQWQIGWTPTYDSAAGALQNWELNGRGTGFKWNGPDPGPDDPEIVYSGTTVLTPSAAWNFSDRLRRYNLTHDNPGLKDLQTTISRMKVLCQSLGGWTENLLMRKAFLELNPLEPGTDDEGPHLSPISGMVQDIEWLSPLVDNPFFPVRAGHLRFKKLWIIDAYGQIIKLEDEKSGANITQPLLPDGLTGPDGYLRLEPRLGQAARLSMDWPAAGQWEAAGEPAHARSEDEAFTPVCGWILPNFLDRSLMIYDDRGNALGALQTVQRKSWQAGVGSELGKIESFHWVDIPGRESFFFGRPADAIVDPLGKQANPHLRAFVKALLSLSEGSGQAFAHLLESMNDALSAGGQTGTGQNPNLALLIGKPLALVRASLSLELNGRPALAQDWANLAAGQTGGIETVKFPIRLGDRQQLGDLWLSEDGLVGFFLNCNYLRFFPAFGLRGRNDDYSQYQMVPDISVNDPLDLTLLMDPARGVCATCGILPRKKFDLPYGDLTETLENKEIVFFTGPIVGTGVTADKAREIKDAAYEIRMPQPSDIYGQWSWTHHPEVKVWREASIVDSQKEQGRFFEESLRITEGWLTLVTAPLEIRGFRVIGVEPQETGGEADPQPPIGQPESFIISSGRALVLSWAVIGAEAIELRQGTLSLFRSDRHPLPAQYRVQVEQNTEFTLIATGRAPKSAAASEPKLVTAVKTIRIIIDSQA